MVTQQLRREMTKGGLIQAGIEVLVAEGYPGFTTFAVAHKAGLSNGALFRHFPTKADLLGEVVEEIFRLLRDNFIDSFVPKSPGDSPISPNELISLLWSIMTDEKLGAVYELYGVARRDLKLRETIATVLKDHIIELEAVGISVLTSALDIDADLAKNVVWLTIFATQGASINSLVLPGQDTTVELLDTLATLALSIRDIQTKLLSSKRSK